MPMDTVIDEAGPRRLFGRASIVTAGTVYRQIVSFMSGLIVARVIGAADYGIFNLARSLVEVTGIFTRLGLDLGLQRYFGENNTAQHRALRPLMLLRVRLLTCTLALVPVIALALGLGRFLEDNVYQYDHFAEVLLYLALALPFMTDIGVLGGAYRGILKLTPSVIAECVLLPTIRLAVILILFMAGWRLWGVVVGTTLGSILASAFLAMRARSDFPAAAPARPQPWSSVLGVLGYSSVLAGSMIVTSLTMTIDTLMMGHFATAQELGQYSLVKTLVILTVVFGAACGQGMEALVADRHFRGDVGGMVHVMSVTARLIVLVTVPIFAMFLFWGAQITQLFGPSFVTPQAVVGWLATASFVAIVFWPSATALSMTGKHFLELKILSAGLVIAALLCWFAIPEFGQIGAAVAMCSSVLMVNLARVLFVRRSIGAFPFRSDIFLITAAGIGLAWGSNLIVAQFPLSPIWSVVCGIGGFVLAYAVAGWMHLLSDAERSSIHAAIGSAVAMLFRRRN
jgi:O-antigen/teichoic acid export membrane protein